MEEKVRYSDRIFYMKPKNPVKLDYSNVFSFISLIGPFFVMALFVVLSIFNSDFKGFIYLFGVIIMSLFIKLLKVSDSIPDIDIQPTYENNFCTLFGMNEQSIPSFNSAIYIFTLVYLCLPMFSKSIFNLPIIIFFLLMYALDAMTRNNIGCTNLSGILIGTFVGFTWGIIYYYILQSSDDTKKFLYYSDFESNKVACLRPKNQKFRCNVYQNGELIQSI